MPRLGTRRTKCLQDENPLYFVSLPSGDKHLKNKDLSKKSDETESIWFQIYSTNLTHSQWFPEQGEYGKCPRWFFKAFPSRAEFQRLERFLSLFCFIFKLLAQISLMAGIFFFKLP